MDTPSPSLRTLAQRLLTLEGATNTAHSHRAAQVFEKLGVALTQFAGPDGFASLMRRSLALARAETPSLESVKFNPDGSLEGLEAATSDAAAGIVANLLGLLVTFIGEPLTLRMVREAWPDASFDELD